MKLKPFEKLLVNIEGFLYKPELVQYDGHWVPNAYDAWTYRARIIFAVGVKPMSLRTLQNSFGCTGRTTCPRFIGHTILESDTFLLSDEPNATVSRYHAQVERLAPYLLEHSMYADITHAPLYYSLTDSRFTEALKPTESRQ